MLIYTPVITPRLQYIAEFSGKEISGNAFALTTDKEIYLGTDGPRINYSPARIAPDDYWILPHGLLTETGISSKDTDCTDWNGLPVFFATSGDLPFDIFSASFFLLSRYEEYLPHKKDTYGRYAHESSLAFRSKFLDRPLVNNWLQAFAKILQTKFPGFAVRKSVFSFLPTYDIDIAWSYKHKGSLRNLGGLLQSFFKGEWKRLGERINVLGGKTKDPYDAYSWMNSLHEKHQLRPYYFFLLAARRAKYDKNISPTHKAMQALISDHLIRYPLGIHPSWQSGDDPVLLEKEIATLAGITGAKVVSSRQHYIRFNLPDGYRRLIEKGIQFDFSMGYGTINGFRASVCSPFYWYELDKEKQSELLVFPFCYMEANSYYEQGYTSAQALEEMRHYHKVVKEIDGSLIMIWHNSFLGTDTDFAGWREVYEKFVIEAAGRKNVGMW